MKVVIIEDEQLAADNLENLIHSIDPDINVIAKIESVRNAIPWLENHSCDLIFLDIQLSDGNSFSIFEQTEVNTPVIFTTAFDQYAIKAFKLNSIDYLLKPIEIRELKFSIDKFKDFHQNHNFDFKSLINSIKKTATYQGRFMVYAGQKIKTVKTSEISYFFVRDGAVFLFTNQGKQYDLDYTLDKLQNILDPEYFFRINRQFIVHIDSIAQMYPLSKSRFKLQLNPACDMDAVVSFNNVHDFKAWLNR